MIHGAMRQRIGGVTVRATLLGLVPLLPLAASNAQGSLVLRASNSLAVERRDEIVSVP